MIQKERRMQILGAIVEGQKSDTIESLKLQTEAELQKFKEKNNLTQEEFYFMEKLLREDDHYTNRLVSFLKEKVEEQDKASNFINEDTLIHIYADDEELMELIFISSIAFLEKDLEREEKTMSKSAEYNVYIHTVAEDIEIGDNESSNVFIGTYSYSNGLELSI